MVNTESCRSPKITKEINQNRSLYELKIRYFTNKYANPLKLRRRYNKNWDFIYNEKDLKSLKQIKQIITNHKDNNINSNITLFFTDNPKYEITINCNINDFLRDITERIKYEFEIKVKDSLFIYNAKRLNIDTSIRKSSLTNKSIITVISDVQFC